MLHCAGRLYYLVSFSQYPYGIGIAIAITHTVKMMLRQVRYWTQGPVIRAGAGTPRAHTSAASDLSDLPTRITPCFSHQQTQ